MNVIRHIIVRGRVQRVGYRAWTQQNALQRGLEGWVRNREDGSVEAMLCGRAEDVAAMIAACRIGPPNASVDNIAQRDASEGEKAMQRPGERFSVLPTA
jgi:acylphosphatase